VRLVFAKWHAPQSIEKNEIPEQFPSFGLMEFATPAGGNSGWRVLRAKGFRLHDERLLPRTLDKLKSEIFFHDQLGFMLDDQQGCFEFVVDIFDNRMKFVRPREDSHTVKRLPSQFGNGALLRPPKLSVHE
jgi:hypothetical protein